MAEKKKKTADEIVDDVASELGVENEKVPDSDESAEDVMAGLGGIFDVPKKKKKKKKKPAPEEVAEEAEADADEAEADADEDEEEAEAEDANAEEEKPKKPEAEKPKKKKKKDHGIDGIFTPSRDAEPLSDDYLNSDDLGEYDVPQKSNSMIWAAVIIGVLALGAVAIFTVGDAGDIAALFRGELKERRLAEKERIEDEYRQAQLEKLEIFGSLMISGSPQYAVLKMDGQIPFGQTSSGEWREMLLTTGAAFQDVKVKPDHKIEVSAPGFDTQVTEIKRGMWQENSSGGANYMLSTNLVPSSMEAKQEFDMRMTADVETDYYGSIEINTMPSGAKVIFNNHPLVDKDGNDLKTPVKFTSNWVKDEKTGKLEERLVNVDTVLDAGHKIQVQLESETEPKYVTELNRPMWTCTWKSEADLKKIKYDADKDSIQKKCDYSWKMTMDFNALKTYIADREAERKRIEAERKAFNEEMAKKRKELQGK